MSGNQSIRQAVSALMARHRNEPWFCATRPDEANELGIVLVVKRGCPFAVHRPVMDYPVRIEVRGENGDVA